MIFSMSGGQVVIEIAVVFVPVRFRHEHLDVLADHLVLAVAKEPFRRRVHRLHLSKLVDREDRIDGRVQNGACSRLAVLEFPDRLLQIR